MDDAETRARVQRGAEMLDRAYGGRAVWARAIDTHRLNLTDGRACVLGQLFHSYDVGVETLLGGSFSAGETHGFDAYPSPDWPTTERQYSELRQHWRRLIDQAAQDGPAQFEIMSTWTADPDRIAGSEGTEFFYWAALTRLADLRDSDPDNTHQYSIRLVGPPAPIGVRREYNGG
jgi:hypothetical protein